MITKDVHKRLGHNAKVKAMALHCGRDSTIQKILNRFFVHNIKSDFQEFIKKGDQCQKQEKFKKYQVNFLASPLKLT